MAMRTLGAGVALLALSACNLAPRYMRPAAPVPPALPQGVAYPSPGATDGHVDEIGWRTFFVDQRLQGVIEQTLANNRDLRIAVANVAQARALYRVQRADQFPAIAAGASASASRSNGQRNDSFGINGGVSAFELDLFGRQRNLSAAAFQRYLASDEGRKAAQIALVAEVANAWLTYGATADALKIAQETARSQEQTLTVNQRREAIGIGTGLAVAQAQTALDSARADVADYATQLAQARNALDLLAGASVADAALPQSLGMGDQTLLALPVGLDSSVLLRRPDVQQAEHTLIGANASIGAARAAFFPSISLTGLLGLASNTLSGLFSGGTFGWNAAASASLPIFDAGARSGNLAYAKATRDAAVASYEKAIQTAFREVADALARRGTIDAKLAAQQSLAANADKALSITQARYANGIATFLEPLDAQRTAYAARHALVAARLERAGNMVELYRSLGGGLTP